MLTKRPSIYANLKATLSILEAEVETAPKVLPHTIRPMILNVFYIL
jgi:hypothetical protein